MIPHPCLTFVIILHLLWASYFGSHKKIIKGSATNGRVRKALPRPNQTGEHWHMRTEPQSIGSALYCTHETAAIITLATFPIMGLCNKSDGQNTLSADILSAPTNFVLRLIFFFWSRETEVGIVIRLQTRQSNNRTSITGRGKWFYSSPKSANRLHSPPILL